MPEKILYILGAGASVNALPLARSVGDPLDQSFPIIKGLAYDLANFEWPKVEDELDEDEIKIMNGLNSDFKDLAAKANEYGDVDTFAKYLNLMNPLGDELMKLKRTLSIYFSIKQKLAHSIDKRYVPWMVSLMERKIFPDNIKILSWNYDYQVQLASSQLDGGLEEVNHSGSGFSYDRGMINHFPNLDPTFNDYNTLSLIQLNGIAGYVQGSDLETAGIFQKHFNRLEKMYNLLGKPSLKPHIHFAWEPGQYHDNLMGHVFQMIDRTTILVVIGYSFPFFNRRVDKQIFEKLNNAASGFKKIYYQDPVLTGQQLRAQFGLRDSVDIVHVKQTDNFHIPFEY